MDKELINTLMAISGAFAVSEHENKALKAEVQRLEAFNELTNEIESLDAESGAIKQLQASLREAKNGEEYALSRLNEEHALNESQRKKLKELEDVISSLRKEKSVLVETLEDTKVTLANEYIKVDKLKQANTEVKKEVSSLQNKHSPVFNLADVLKERLAGSCTTMFSRYR